MVGGIASGAGVVTSAAVIMVAVFSIFATLSLIDLKIIGVGMAAAVLIDATVVRGILVPAALALLGERTWYLPHPLHRRCTRPAGHYRPTVRRYGDEQQQREQPTTTARGGLGGYRRRRGRVGRADSGRDQRSVAQTLR